MLHQPPYEVVRKFGLLVLLARGHLAYIGKVSDLSEHLEGMGLRAPALINPADWWLECLTLSSSAAFPAEQSSDEERAAHARWVQTLRRADDFGKDGGTASNRVLSLLKKEERCPFSGRAARGLIGIRTDHSLVAVDAAHPLPCQVDLLVGTEGPSSDHAVRQARRLDLGVRCIRPTGLHL